MTRQKHVLQASSKRGKIQTEELQVGQPWFNWSENHEKHPLGKHYRAHTDDDDGEKH